jgi:nucleoside-diphosphate-sugar epimerase
MRIVVAGGAGLVGQNLIARGKASNRYQITAIDKHKANLATLQRLHPTVSTIEADMAEPGAWEDSVAGCDVLVLLQAQIGGIVEEEFRRNNMVSTERALRAAEGGRRPYLIHVSSSVVNSKAEDFYTKSKAAQERLVAASSLTHIILRPTLMFGWFDRKHLGWLRRFMDRAPVFPIPSDGRFLRQPLYAGDFAAIIATLFERRMEGIYNISGQETINYIDLIRLIKEITKAKARLVQIPIWFFATLLRAYALIDRNPPFTVNQLKALATPDVFEVIDWPGIFGVPSIPLRKALEETFLDPVYGRVVLEF